MFAVIGTWAVDGPVQEEQLEHIAATVRGQPGFVRGYWGQAPDDDTSAHAVVVLEQQADAEALAAAVAGAIPSATLQVVRVLAAAEA